MRKLGGEAGGLAHLVGIPGQAGDKLAQLRLDASQLGRGEPVEAQPDEPPQQHNPQHPEQGDETALQWAGGPNDGVIGVFVQQQRTPGQAQRGGVGQRLRWARLDHSVFNNNHR